MIAWHYWPSGEVETRRIANPPCTDAISVWASMSEHKQLKISQQAVLRNKEGQVLILLKTNSEHWLLPGGRLEEEDTSPMEGFHREISEEIGSTISVVRPMAIDSSPSWNVYAIAFLCEFVGEPTIHLSPEHSEYKWVHPSEICEYLYYKKIAEAIAEQLA